MDFRKNGSGSLDDVRIEEIAQNLSHEAVCGALLELTRESCPNLLQELTAASPSSFEKLTVEPFSQATTTTAKTAREAPKIQLNFSCSLSPSSHLTQELIKFAPDVQSFESHESFMGNVPQPISHSTPASLVELSRDGSNRLNTIIQEETFTGFRSKSPVGSSSGEENIPSRATVIEGSDPVYHHSSQNSVASLNDDKLQPIEATEEADPNVLASSKVSTGSGNFHNIVDDTAYDTMSLKQKFEKPNTDQSNHSLEATNLKQPSNVKIILDRYREMQGYCAASSSEESLSKRVSNLLSSYPSDDPARSMTIVISSESGSEDEGKEKSAESLSGRVRTLLEGTAHLRSDSLSSQLSLLAPSGSRYAASLKSSTSTSTSLPKISSDVESVPGQQGCHQPSADCRIRMETPKKFSWDYSADLAIDGNQLFVSSRKDIDLESHTTASKVEESSPNSTSSGDATPVVPASFISNPLLTSGILPIDKALEISESSIPHGTLLAASSSHSMFTHQYSAINSGNDRLYKRLTKAEKKNDWNWQGQNFDENLSSNHLDELYEEVRKSSKAAHMAQVSSDEGSAVPVGHHRVPRLNLSHLNGRECESSSGRSSSLPSSARSTHLRPYRPHGSTDLYYVEKPATEEVIQSDTTVESSHPGSDDAHAPCFPRDILGSRCDPVCSIPGIYRKHHQSNDLHTIEETALEQQARFQEQQARFQEQQARFQGGQPRRSLYFPDDKFGAEQVLHRSQERFDEYSNKHGGLESARQSSKDHRTCYRQHASFPSLKDGEKELLPGSNLRGFTPREDEYTSKSLENVTSGSDLDQLWNCFSRQALRSSAANPNLYKTLETRKLNLEELNAKHTAAEDVASSVEVYLLPGKSAAESVHHSSASVVVLPVVQGTSDMVDLSNPGQENSVDMAVHEASSCTEGKRVSPAAGTVELVDKSTSPVFSALEKLKPDDLHEQLKTIQKQLECRRSEKRSSTGSSSRSTVAATCASDFVCSERQDKRAQLKNFDHPSAHVPHHKEKESFRHEVDNQAGGDGYHSLFDHFDVSETERSHSAFDQAEANDEQRDDEEVYLADDERNAGLSSCMEIRAASDEHGRNSALEEPRKVEQITMEGLKKRIERQKIKQQQQEQKHARRQQKIKLLEEMIRNFSLLESSEAVHDDTSSTITSPEPYFLLPGRSTSMKDLSSNDSAIRTEHDPLMRPRNFTRVSSLREIQKCHDALDTGRVFVTLPDTKAKSSRKSLQPKPPPTMKLQKVDYTAAQNGKEQSLTERQKEPTRAGQRRHVGERGKVRSLPACCASIGVQADERRKDAWTNIPTPASSSPPVLETITVMKPPHRRKFKPAQAWSIIIKNNNEHQEEQERLTRAEERMQRSRGVAWLSSSGKVTLQGAFEAHKADLIERSRMRQKQIAYRAEKRRLSEVRGRELMHLENKFRRTTPSKCTYSTYDRYFKPMCIVSRKQMREETRKRFHNLPEQKEKVKKKQREEQMQTNRARANIYKQTLQNNILKKQIASR